MLELLTAIETRYDELTQQLGSPDVLGNPAKLRAVGQEHRKLEQIVTVGREYRTALREIAEAEIILADDGDPEMLELASSELEHLGPERDRLEARLRGMLVPPDPLDDRGIILEIRAGTGGEEAALFAADLMRMYQRFAERQNWKIEPLSSNATGIGGLKEVAVAISGRTVYGMMKHESGVHRVQRVPQTEASGRIHTSAASVAVLPEAEDVDIAINEQDLKIDVFRSTGPGGQSVNTTDSAVRITHIPTDTVVTCQDEKSQHKNRAKALKVLRARLFAAAEAERQSRIAAERRGMVGSGDRSEKIRTYNFPQNRVTDHRIGMTLQKLNVVLEGDMGELVDALVAAERERRFASWQDDTPARQDRP